jgi:DNA-binding SARP family transcriptional activator
MLRLTLFGGFGLLGSDGSAVVIASRKCRALLAFMALQARPIERERLAGLLWGEGSDARGRGSLRQALTTLRREVPGDGAWLAASAESVAVDRAVFWVDAVEAEAQLTGGEPARALDLSGRGELLAGLSLGVAEFDEWREGEQRRWRERETTALQALSGRAHAAGRHEELLTLGRRQLKLEPWNEEAHRAVMHAFAGLGRYSEAMRQFQIAREILRDELGVAPGPETEKLHFGIRAQRTAPSPAPLFLAPVAPVPVGPSVGVVHEPVGREVEGLQIEGLLRGCRASGRGHLILIRGEAGMGKTTFLGRALARASALGFPTHLLAAVEYGSGRNSEVVCDLLTALEASAHGPPEHRLALDEMQGNALDPAEAALAEALDPDARAQAHARALEALVAAAGARQPRVIAIEDLHWCDSETTQILCAVAGAAPQHRTVMVFTCRSGEEPTDLAWTALVRRGSVTSIDLGRLAEAEAVHLAARWSDSDPERVRRCVERAAGHPLFLVQLLEQLRDNGQTGESVPQSLQAAVLARLARAAPADRRVLDAAAVLATAFSLAQMGSLLEGEAVDITALVQQGWLRPAGARFALAHDLVATAIRSALDEPSLARLHVAAAAWFAGRDPLTSAEHLERAGDPGTAAAYLSVAREALRERRLDLVETLLARVDACAADAVLAFEALCLRGDVRRERGDAAGSHAVFARAAGLARSDEQRVSAQLGLAEALRLLDRHQEALACLVEVDALSSGDDHGVRARLEQLRGNLLFTAGDRVGCLTAHQHALAHARAADSPSDEAAALSGLGDALYLGGRLRSAAAAFEACRTLARTAGLLRLEGASSMMLANLYLYDNQVAPARAALVRAIELGEQVADPRLQSLSQSVAAFIERECGDWTAARRHSELAQAAARRLGSERDEAMAIDGLARARLAEGRQRDALGLVRQGLACCERSGGLAIFGPGLLAIRARAESDPHAARQALAESEALLAAGGPGHCHFEVREAGITIALAARDPVEALRHAVALEAHLGDEPNGRSRLLIAGTRASAALLAPGTPAAVAAARAEIGRLKAEAEAAGLALLAGWLERSTFTLP